MTSHGAIEISRDATNFSGNGLEEFALFPATGARIGNVSHDKITTILAFHDKWRFIILAFHKKFDDRIEESYQFAKFV
jgi:hypothetical protein